MNDDTPRDRPAPRADDETQPVRAEGAIPAAPVEPAAQRRGFRERLRSVSRDGGSRTFGLAALIASTLAGVIVGGLGFAAVHAVTDDGDRDRGGWVQRRDADDRGPGRGGMHGGPRGVPGQLAPSTAPEDDEDSAS